MILFVLFCAFDRLDEVKIFLHLPLKPNDGCTLLLLPWLTSWMKSGLLFQNDWLTYILDSIYHLWETGEIIFPIFIIFCSMFKKFCTTTSMVPLPLPPPPPKPPVHHHRHYYCCFNYCSLSQWCLLQCHCCEPSFSPFPPQPSPLLSLLPLLPLPCPLPLPCWMAGIWWNGQIKANAPVRGKTLSLTMKISTQVYVHFKLFSHSSWPQRSPAKPNIV